MTQKAEMPSSSACLLCQGQCSSDWKRHNCMREMKSKIGEGVLKEHLAALNEPKFLASDQLYSGEMRELAQYGPTLLSVVFEELCYHWR